jgi:hypothetical protein
LSSNLAGRKRDHETLACLLRCDSRDPLWRRCSKCSTRSGLGSKRVASTAVDGTQPCFAKSIDAVDVLPLGMCQDFILQQLLTAADSLQRLLERSLRATRRGLTVTFPFAPAALAIPGC